MREEEIVEQILCNLDGWILETKAENETLTDMDFNKTVSSKEVLHFYNTAYNYALSYTRLSEFPTRTYETEDGAIVTDLNSQVFTALCLWSAGLIYRKYNVRSNDQIDEDYPIGYGDSLIIQAKEMLKGYKSYSFYAY